jgi:hypothetical protein
MSCGRFTPKHCWCRLQLSKSLTRGLMGSSTTHRHCKGRCRMNFCRSWQGVKRAIRRRLTTSAVHRLSQIPSRKPPFPKANATSEKRHFRHSKRLFLGGHQSNRKWIASRARKEMPRKLLYSLFRLAARSRFRQQTQKTPTGQCQRRYRVFNSGR